MSDTHIQITPVGWQFIQEIHASGSARAAELQEEGIEADYDIRIPAQQAVPPVFDADLQSLVVETVCIVTWPIVSSGSTWDMGGPYACLGTDGTIYVRDGRCCNTWLDEHVYVPLGASGSELSLAHAGSRAFLLATIPVIAQAELDELHRLKEEIRRQKAAHRELLDMVIG